MKRTVLLITLIILSLHLLAQDATKYITLQKEKSPLRFTNFHITAVHDSRSDTSNIGIIHTGLTGKKSTVLKLNPSLPASLEQFIKTNYIQDTSTSPVELRISRLQIEHIRNGLKSHTGVSMGMAFYTKGEKITDFNGDGYTEGPGDPAKFSEELIRKNLESGLEKFDIWWARNKNQFYANGGAPTSVTVEAAIVDTIDDSDMIVYSRHRPLKLEYFSGATDDLSLAAAVTHSGIQVRSTSEMRDGQLKVKINIIPYFDKRRSWCRKASRNSWTLSHEQRHFDITALKACDLLQKVQQFKFTSNFIKELDLLHKQNDLEWDQQQRQYDSETKHGQAASAQQKWNKSVKEELAKRSCFK
jgi:hypothetical protein